LSGSDDLEVSEESGYESDAGGTAVVGQSTIAVQPVVIQAVERSDVYATESDIPFDDERERVDGNVYKLEDLIIHNSRDAEHVRLAVFQGKLKDLGWKRRTAKGQPLTWVLCEDEEEQKRILPEISSRYVFLNFAPEKWRYVYFVV